MKTAICFSGLVGSTKGKSQELIGDFDKCFRVSSKLYKKHIIDKNDVDIFVHSWSTSMEDKIIKTYEPKNHLIEKQIIFDIPDYITNKTSEVRKQTHYSLWYSRKKSVELKNKYAKENGIKYDCVMLARFDLAWQTDLIFNDYDQGFFWTQNWPKKSLKGRTLSDLEYWKMSDFNLPFKTHWYGYPNTNDGLLGMWFFSNPDYIDKFVTLYDKLDEYSKPNRCPLDQSGAISAHQQCLYHLENLGIKDKLRFTKNWHDDCPSVRRKYFKEK
jgi:hypothetical protein